MSSGILPVPVYDRLAVGTTVSRALYFITSGLRPVDQAGTSFVLLTSSVRTTVKLKHGVGLFDFTLFEIFVSRGSRSASNGFSESKYTFSVHYY